MGDEGWVRVGLGLGPDILLDIQPEISGIVVSLEIPGIVVSLEIPVFPIFLVKIPEKS